MQICAIGDSHFHNWPYGATPEAGGVNSRFLHILRSFEFALGHGASCDATVFLGDLFHTKGTVPFAVFNPVHRMLRTHGQKHLFLLKGNHDEAVGQNAVHALQPFEEIPRLTVIDRPQVVGCGGDRTLVFMPFFRSHEDWLAGLEALLPEIDAMGRPTTLCAHNMLMQPRVGSADFVMADYIQIPHDWLLRFDLIVVGHVHDRQTLRIPGWDGSIYYPGSLCQFTAGDVGRDKTIAKIRLGTPHEIEEIQNPHGPYWFRVDMKDEEYARSVLTFAKAMPGQVFVEVIGERSKEFVDELRDEGAAAKVRLEAAKQREARVSFSMTEGPAKIVAQYLDHAASADVDRDSYLRTGLEILERAL